MEFSWTEWSLWRLTDWEPFLRPGTLLSPFYPHLTPKKDDLSGQRGRFWKKSHHNSTQNCRDDDYIPLRFCQGSAKEVPAYKPCQVGKGIWKLKKISRDPAYKLPAKTEPWEKIKELRWIYTAKNQNTEPETHGFQVNLLYHFQVSMSNFEGVAQQNCPSSPHPSLTTSFQPCFQSHTHCYDYIMLYPCHSTTTTTTTTTSSSIWHLQQFPVLPDSPHSWTLAIGGFPMWRVQQWSYNLQGGAAWGATTGSPKKQMKILQGGPLPVINEVIRPKSRVRIRVANLFRVFYSGWITPFMTTGSFPTLCQSQVIPI